MAAFVLAERLVTSAGGRRAGTTLVSRTGLSMVQFLSESPNAGYTGARTLGRTSVIELGSHIKRLAETLKGIAFAGNAGVEEERITTEMRMLRRPESLATEIMPLLRDGITAWAGIEPVKEAQIMLMGYYDLKEMRPRLLAHFSPLRNHPTEPVAVDVEVKGQLRENPSLKQSDWVRQREFLEKGKRAESNEVILMDENGQVYEGISSNFFAVMPAGIDHSGPSVWYAPPGTILQGTIQNIVGDVCEELGIPVVREFPRIPSSVSPDWLGAFITSTSRLALQVKTLHFRTGREDIILPAECRLIKQIQEEVHRRVKEHATHIL